MSVFVSAEIKLTNVSWVADYGANVHPIVEKHGSKYLSRSRNVTVLEGEGRGNT